MSTLAISSPLLCLLVLFSPSPCADANPVYHNCNKTGKYAVGSTYQSNLAHLLSSLAFDGRASVRGFFTTTFGQTPDTVYGLVLCRGDINASDCSSCAGAAARGILQLCPYDKGAAVWYEHCLLRYSDHNLLSPTTTYSPEKFVNNTRKITADPWTAWSLKTVMYAMASSAASSKQKFATVEVKTFLSGSPSIYILGQCIPDLSREECSRCLDVFVNETLEGGIDVEQGGWALGTMCNLRYGVDHFYYGEPTMDEIPWDKPPAPDRNPRTLPSPAPPPVFRPSPPVLPKPPAGEAAQQTSKMISNN